MAIYARQELAQEWKVKFLDQCPSTQSCDKLNLNDIKIMFYCHLFCIYSIVQGYVFKNFKLVENKPYEFICTFVKTANIFIYQFSLLYIQYNIYLDIDQCKTEGDSNGFMETCHPLGYAEMSPKEQEKVWHDLQQVLDDLNQYRLIEIGVFYTQLVALMSYIIFCKAFL